MDTTRIPHVYNLDHRNILSTMSVGAPSRPLDEFEQLVYEYTLRMGLGGYGHDGNEEVPFPTNTTY